MQFKKHQSYGMHTITQIQLHNYYFCWPSPSNQRGVGDHRVGQWWEGSWANKIVAWPWLGCIRPCISCTQIKVMQLLLVSRVTLILSDLLGLKGLVKEMHCCPSCTKPDTSVTSLVQVDPVVVSTVSGHAPDPPRHYAVKMFLNYTWLSE